MKQAAFTITNLLARKLLREFGFYGFVAKPKQNGFKYKINPYPNLKPNYNPEASPYS